MGFALIELWGIVTKFHVFADPFPLPGNGIIGLEFLRAEKAEISFHHDTMVLDSNPIKPIPFLKMIPIKEESLGSEPIIAPILPLHSPSKEPSQPKEHSTSPSSPLSTYFLKARTRKVIAVDVTNSEIEQGYLPRIQTSEGVIIGNAIVNAKNGRCYVMAINTTERDVNVKIEPQELSPYDVFDEESGDINDIILGEKTILTREERVAKILEKIDCKKLGSRRYARVKSYVESFPELFLIEGDELPGTTLTEHRIPTTDDAPVFKKQYRYPQILKPVIIKQLNKLLKANIIRPSNSPNNAPLWIVSKKPDKNGIKQWRLVIDYRGLNEKTVGDAYPLPLISEILDHLGKSKYFSVFDLASGFHQIPMAPEDRWKTAFSDGTNHYEFNRMPFGLKGGPTTFQRLMNNVLTGLNGSELFVYLDDIVVFAASLDEHDQKIFRLFRRLYDSGLRLQPEKCVFLSEEVSYLGHVISSDGVRPNPEKIKAVEHFPVPKTPKNIKEFLGLIGYYRRFIPNVASRAKPLTKLLRKNQSFIWEDEQQASFEDLRKCLCQEPILQYPDFEQPFILTTDASNGAIAAVLSQGKLGSDLPIAYASRCLNRAEMNYSTTEKECLAVAVFTKYYHHYLYGRKFTVVTDHQALVWLHNTRDPSSRLVRWRLKLLDYDYEVKYRPGRVNSNADALSRNPVETKESEEKIASFPIVTVKKRRGRPPREVTPIPASPTESQMVEESGIADRVKQRRRNNEPRYYSSYSSDDEIDRCNVSGRQTMHQKKTRKRLIRFPGDDDYLPPPIAQTISSPPQLDEPVVSLPPAQSDSDSDSNDNTLIDMNETVIPVESVLEDTLINSPSPDLPSKTPLIIPSVPLPSQNANVKESKILGLYESIPPPERESNLTTSQPQEVQTDRSTNSPVGLIIKTTRDPLTLSRDNIAHFLSADCTFGTTSTRTLIDIGLINPINIKSREPKKGQVIVTQTGKSLVFSIFVKNKFFDKINAEDLLLGISSLKMAVEKTGINSLRMSLVENDLEKLPPFTLRNTIQHVFTHSNVIFTLCTGKIQVPPEDMRKAIISEYHSSLVGGHKGVTKTFRLIRNRFVWPELKKNVENFVRTCISCQRQKLVRIKTRQPMVITDTPADAFDKVSMDLVGPLPITPDENQYVLTIQDNLTKYCLGFPIKNKRASTVADIFARKFIATFGCPRAILTDQGKEFINDLLSNLATIFKIKHVTTSGYHPQSNGSLERSHQVLIDYLKHYINDYEDWDRLVPFAMLSYNCAIHEGTQFSPHELIFGKTMRIPSSFPPTEQLQTYGSYLQEMVTHLADIRLRARNNLINAKERSKKRYDIRSNPKEFKPGDLILVLSEPRDGKLGAYYHGPYPIVEVLDYETVVFLNDEGKRVGKHINKIKIAHIDELSDSTDGNESEN